MSFVEYSLCSDFSNQLLIKKKLPICILLYILAAKKKTEKSRGNCCLVGLVFVVGIFFAVFFCCVFLLLLLLLFLFWGFFLKVHTGVKDALVSLKDPTFSQAGSSTSVRSSATVCLQISVKTPPFSASGILVRSTSKMW